MDTDKMKLENENSALGNGDGERSVSDEEIIKNVSDFFDKWFIKWEKYCQLCKARNCRNNDSCIKCGCQF